MNLIIPSMVAIRMFSSEGINFSCDQDSTISSAILAHSGWQREAQLRHVWPAEMMSGHCNKEKILRRGRSGRSPMLAISVRVRLTDLIISIFIIKSSCHSNCFIFNESCFVFQQKYTTYCQGSTKTLSTPASNNLYDKS